MTATPAADMRSKVQSVLRDPTCDNAESTVALLFKRVLGPRPDNPDSLRKLAEVTLDLGAAPAAKEIYLRFLARSPNDVYALYGLAEACRRCGHTEDAMGAIEEALSVDPHMQWMRGARFSLPGILDRMIGTRRAVLTEKVLARLKRLGEILAASRDIESLRAGITLANSGRDELFGAEDAIHRMRGTLGLLGFAKSAPRDWNKHVFNDLALPWLKQALKAEFYSLGLELESIIYTEFVLQIETEEHFRQCLSSWTDDMRSAGHRAAQSIRANPVADISSSRIGFFVHTSAMLAHTDLLCAYLKALTRSASSPVEPRVYIMQVRDDNTPLAVALRSLGVPVTWLSDHCAPREEGRFALLAALRQQVVQDKLAALVWISLALHMPFAFAMRVAPVQIWWAMKYHSLEFPEIDGYVTIGGIAREKRFGSRTWRTGGIAARDWCEPELESEAAAIRAGLGADGVILGSFGREEKLDSGEFLESVAAILRHTPNALFLWTGRNRLASIEDRLAGLGVARQCRYVGWVNTKLYAHVIDIFLDSFPFPCGVTAVHALACGKPIVLFESAEAYETGLYGIIAPLLDGTSGTDEQRRRATEIFLTRMGSLFLAAKDATQYIKLARRMIADANLRRAVGAAYRTFIDEFLSDPERVAENYTRHFLEIIAENRVR